MTTNELDWGEGELLIHYGAKGMKWGVTKNRTSSDAPARAPLSKTQKQAVIATVTIGVAAVASIMLTPAAGIVVGSLGRMGSEALNIKTTETSSTPGKGGDNKYDIERNSIGVLAPRQR